MSGTEDGGWIGDMKGEGVMICRVSRHAVRRLHPPFLVDGGCKEGGREGNPEGSDSQDGLDWLPPFARSLPSHIFHPPLFSPPFISYLIR